jgi:hypothetical protein
MPLINHYRDYFTSKRNSDYKPHPSFRDANVEKMCGLYSLKYSISAIAFTYYKASSEARVQIGF